MFDSCTTMTLDDKFCTMSYEYICWLAIVENHKTVV